MAGQLYAGDQQSKVIHVVMDNNYPPYVFLDNEGQAQGILIDQWRLWESKTGIKADIHAMDWGEAIRRMKTGEFDVIDTIFKTSERTDWLDFSASYARIQVPIFFDRRISGITGLASLKGFTVAAKKGDNAVEQLRQNGITSLQLYSGYEPLMRAAAEHKVNVFVVDAPSAYYFLNKFGIQDEFRASAPVNEGQLSRAVKKGNMALLKAVDAGFAAITSDELEHINDKWLGTTVGRGPVWKMIIYGAGLAGVIIAGLAGWNWMLSRQVNRRTRSLRESEANLSSQRNFIDAVLENAGVVVVVLGPEGKICRFNHTAEQLSGYHFREVEGRRIWETGLLPSDEAEAIYKEAFLKIWKDAPLSKTGRYTNYWVSKSGERRLFDWFNTVLFDSHGHPEFVVGVGVDITERRQAEATLRDSEERFREVVENIQEVFWVSDSDNRVLYVSPAYEKIWGRPLDSFCESWLESIHEADRERVVKMAESASHDEARSNTYRIVRPDGGVRWIYAQVFPVKDASGAVIRTVGTARDITERKELEEQLLRSQRMDAMGSLVGGIAHDLNNIFAPVLMLSSTLKLTMTDERNRKLMAMLEQNAQRGAEIIRQLLTFSRGSAGTLSLIKPTELIEEVANIVRETFPREIACETTHDTVVAHTLLADSTQLHQVLLNLCVNARDAMPMGGKLTLSASNIALDEKALRLHPGALPGNYVKFDVADTGIGISADVIERIFDPFFTTKPIGKGTGLGLSTVLGITRGHGGFVTVKSFPGRGSVFSIHLPASGYELAADSSMDPSVPRAGAGKKILVVDDEPAICTATKFILENKGFSVLTAESGAEALLCLAANPETALVITDIMMADMNGITLILELRRRHSHLRIIATTGMIPDEMNRELAALGVTHILKKPSASHAILEAIERELGETP
ncbi:MAG TPA: transporter substrate-binding domain-containing protein [Rariglobus sp.]|nr:transporter substrate-binding domain-containing protein [Rariglobus sp.]